MLSENRTVREALGDLRSHLGQGKVEARKRCTRGPRGAREVQDAR